MIRSCSIRRLARFASGAFLLIIAAGLVHAGQAPRSTLATSLFVPIVLSSGGAGGAFYTSELVLTNRGTSPVTVALRYATAFGGGGGTGSDTLLPGEQKIVPDAIAYLRERNVSIPESGDRGGTLLLTFSGLSASDAAWATIRTTTATGPPLPEGAAGLAYPGVSPASGFTTSATVYGLRVTAHDRANLAIYNPTTEPVTVRVTVISGDGTGTSVVKAEGLEIAGLGWNQLNAVLDGTGITTGWATIEKTGGAGSFGAYGVINDNGTSDGSFVSPVRGDVQGASIAIPAVVETISGFTSELTLANRGDAPATLALSYVESLTPELGGGGSFTLELAPLTQLIVPDAIEFLRVKGLKIGARGAGNYAGALRVDVAGATLSNVFAGARTTALCPSGGRFGLFTPGVYTGEEAQKEVFLHGLRADAFNRSNVAVVHAGADGSGALTLQLQAYDGDAGGIARGEPETIVLGPGAWRQSSGFLGSRGVANGWVNVTRVSGTAPWIAYGVVNDGGAPGERTGDGAYVPMVIPSAGDLPGPEEITYTLPGGVPLVLVRIPGGTFQMGSPATERLHESDETLHEVTLTHDYYVGKYLVTQGQWKAVMGSNPSYFASCGDSCPVESVLWNEVGGPNGFVEKLNQFLTSTGQADAGKLRLPTEAEWERAARAGTQTRFSFGDALGGDDGCGENAAATPHVWWCNNWGGTTHPVGTKEANPYGLYDMHGNVWEHVNDWYGEYGSSARTDPTGPGTGSNRVIRGGGGPGGLGMARSSNRLYINPGRPDSFVGLRLARSL